MPELPEVETIRRQLETEITGAEFLSLHSSHDKSFQPGFEQVQKSIVGKKIETVSRRAKLLIFRLMDGSSLLFHLKLTGRLLLRKPEDKPDDYVRSVFALKTPLGKILELRFCDARKFGFVKLLKTGKEINNLLDKFGPEPFKDLTLKNFSQVLKESRQPVKVLLLDQSKLSGLGNIYANDALWLARINPKIPAQKIKPGQAKKLYQAILAVLKKGLEYGGASDQWYRQLHGELGQYQKHFLVYGRTGEKCRRCSSIIKRVSLAGRGTFFCSRCQPAV